MYIKSAFTYQDETTFGKAINYPEKLAKAVLAITVKCLFGGRDFIYKLNLISNLTAQFLCNESIQIKQAIKSDSRKKTNSC